jgi:hypothetical protein
VCCKDEATYFLENTGGHHARMISVVLCAYQRTSDPASAKGLCPAANASWQKPFSTPPFWHHLPCCSPQPLGYTNPWPQAANLTGALPGHFHCAIDASCLSFLHHPKAASNSWCVQFLVCPIPDVSTVISLLTAHSLLMPLLSSWTEVVSTSRYPG